MKRSKSCLDVEQVTKFTDIEHQFQTTQTILPRQRRSSLPMNYMVPDYQITAENNISQSSPSSDTLIQVENDIVDDSENVDNERPLLNGSASCSKPKSKGIKKSVKKFVVGTATVICSSIAGALACQYYPWGSHIDVPANPTLTTQVPIYSNVDTTVSVTNQDIIRYERVLENGMRQYSFDRKRNRQ